MILGKHQKLQNLHSMNTTDAGVVRYGLSIETAGLQKQKPVGVLAVMEGLHLNLD